MRKKFFLIGFLIILSMCVLDVYKRQGQQIITLSTCHGSGKNGRLIVAAVKM